MKRPMLAALLIAGLGAGAPALADAPELQITDAWARPSVPTRPGAGYFTLVNTGEEADTLTAAEAEGAEKVEIHMVEEKLGVAEMLRVDSFKVEPGEEVVFEPGGMHLMFTGLTEPLAEGDIFPATLVFETAGEVEVAFRVGAEPSTEAGSGDADGSSD